MADRPLAYHITFGTYGTRLHGDPRGTVDRRRSRPGDPIVGQHEAWQQMEARRLRFPPVLLTLPQRAFVEHAVPEVCKRGQWAFQQTACGPDHVHVLLSTDRDELGVRRWLKRWLGEALSARWPLPDGQSWWAKSGSVKWIWDEAYLQNVAAYIRDQRATT